MLGTIRGVNIWRRAYAQFFIPINVCLHCFLSKLKPLFISTKQHVVCAGLCHYFGHGAICASNQFNSGQTGPHIFNRVHTILPFDGNRFGSFAHLCLFSLHKVHISLPQLKAKEHARTVPTPHLLDIFFIFCDVFQEVGV